MRLVDHNLDGDFNDPIEQQYLLANWRGDVVAMLSPGIDLDLNGFADTPAVLARVSYDAYGRPTISHPADMNRDGVIGGSGYSPIDRHR